MSGIPPHVGCPESIRVLGTIETVKSKSFLVHQFARLSFKPLTSLTCIEILGK
ncbi:MAG: hypothetical protein ACJAVI_002323 [Candidatus Azotimanducaceae bacterium]|jgi:hypothetical protein